MKKTVSYLCLSFWLALLLLARNVSADDQLANNPFEKDVLSVQNQGYVVFMFKGIWGAFDYFRFGDGSDFTLGSEVRNGTGDYVSIDNVYFNAQFSGTSNGEEFSYTLSGLNLWGIAIWGGGEYIKGSTSQPIVFSGINSFLYSPFAQEP